ncbi:hypothetical protein LCGC14_2493340, partial [marine sediment metagenome]
GPGFKNPTDEEQYLNLSTNYLFKGTSYTFNLDDYYDDTDLTKTYTGAKFQTEDFNGTSLEWSGTVLNDTVTPVNNTETQYGDPSNINMIEGTTDSMDNMKINDASYTTFTSTHTDPYFYESPTQWEDFIFTEGAGNTDGELETDNDANYAIIDTGFALVDESLLGIIIPTSDILTEWDVDAGPPHWSRLDEGPGAPDGLRIAESVMGKYDSWNFDSLTIPAGRVGTKMVVYGYTLSPPGDTPILVTTNIAGVTGLWSTSPPQWRSFTDTGLDFDQADLDAFTMTVEKSIATGLAIIDAVYVEVWTSLNQYSVDYTITWNVADPDLDSIESFYYDYRTTVPVDTDLDIYNWDTTEWLELESNIGTGWYSGLYALTDPYISGSDEIKIRFQSATFPMDFDMELDQIVLEWVSSLPPADLEMEITFPFARYNEDLLAMNVQSWQRTNKSQTITFKIWNYDTESYTQISSSSDTSFTKKEYNTTSPADFISPTGTVKLYWVGTDL